MTYSKTDKIKAMAIVSIFETSKPFGDYAAVAVLDDGAGISYGVNQFTHRSGSLLEVVNKYLELGGQVGRSAIEESLPLLRRNTARAINALARNERFKKALKAAAITREMREAQEQIASERYLEPAIKACSGSGFVMPLSLAVVYDSMTHGSWEKIRDRVRIAASGDCRQGCLRSDEKEWITRYVRKRDAWLATIPRLAATRYRTRFFLNQIAISNWDLRLPLNVQGVRLDVKLITQAAGRATTPSAEAAATPPLKGGELSDAASGDCRLGACGPTDSAVEPYFEPSEDPPADKNRPDSSSFDHPLTQVVLTKPQAQPPGEEDGETGRHGDAETDAGCLDRIQEKVDSVAAQYDQVEEIVTTVITRKDSAKSLWTTVVGTVSQTVWALFGLLAGVPREVWLVVAVVAAALMLLYLYRQIELGKIRETKM